MWRHEEIDINLNEVTMKLSVILVIIGLGLSFLFGLLTILYEKDIYLECFKIILSFSLLGVLGNLLKNYLDDRRESWRIEQKKEDENQRKTEARQRYWEDVRNEIVNEFIDIFSGFYSLRKFYHSAHSDSNKIFKKNDKDYNKMQQGCVSDATKLEGRYGALKVRMIRHFNLPSGQFGTKSISDIEKKLESEKDEKTRLRFSLDLLGEGYDKWRHAIENNKKIDVDMAWNHYETLLGFLDKVEFPGD